MAFFGLLDANTDTVRFHSAGQGPIMHFHAAGTQQRCLQVEIVAGKYAVTIV